MEPWERQRELIVVQYNLGIKRIHKSHIKLLKVLRSILERIETLNVEDEKAFARATTVRTRIEKEDSDEVLFKTRMAIRSYLKQLRMHMVQVSEINKAKDEFERRSKMRPIRPPSGKKMPSGSPYSGRPPSDGSSSSSSRASIQSSGGSTRPITINRDSTGR
jgi:hypothetical protein